MLPPPPPVPAALRVPYARVTAFKTALLRRLLPPLACLGRPPSGAALRSAVAPHKGQVQRLAWTPRGGGGGAAQRRGRVPDGRQDGQVGWGFLASRLGRRSPAQYRKSPSSDLRQGRLSELLRKGQLLPPRGVAGARGWLNAGQGHVLRAAEPAAAAAWTVVGPGPRWAGIAGRCSGLRHPFPHHDALRSWAGPTTTRTGCGVDELVWRALDPLTVNTKGSAAWRPKTPSSARLLPPRERGVCTGEPPT